MKPISVLKINKSQIQNLAGNLRKLLVERAVTESDLAKELDIPLMTIRRLALGETTDPRLSTLKLIADYFNVSLDHLIEDSNNFKLSITKNTPYFVPILDWKTVSSISSLNELDLKVWKNWHPIALSGEYSLSTNAFALESKPSMQPRFPAGTLFIVDPNEKPIDGDTVLIKMKNTGDLSLRDLVIDPPKWQLLPVIPGSETFFYDNKQHNIVGVIIFTMLYNRNDRFSNK